MIYYTEAVAELQKRSLDLIHEYALALEQQLLTYADLLKRKLPKKEMARHRELCLRFLTTYTKTTDEECPYTLPAGIIRSARTLPTGALLPYATNRGLKAAFEEWEKTLQG